MSTRSQGIAFLPLFAILFIIGCGQSPQPGQAVAATGKPLSPPGHTVLRYAHGFRIDTHDNYRELIILSRAAGKTDSLRYVLVDAGQQPPAGKPGIPVIHTPVTSMAVLSSMHVAMAEFAGVANRITGLGNFQYIHSPIVREGIREGKVKQVGLDGNTNEELLVALHPGVVITSTNPDAAFGQYKTLGDAGIPVVPDAEWLETTPLGRAEWVKLIGALVDKEEDVARKFDSVEQAYQALAAIGRSAKKKPSVILDLPWKGIWYTPAGENYTAQFLRDAGADYHWSDTKGNGSLALNIEAIIPIALKADYWLNIGDVDSRRDIAAKDSRFTRFHAYETDALYNYNRRVNDIGSNDFWESGAVNPQLVLGDLIRILHPGLLPGDSLYYYKQLK